MMPGSARSTDVRLGQPERGGERHGSLPELWLPMRAAPLPDLRISRPALGGVRYPVWTPSSSGHFPTPRPPRCGEVLTVAAPEPSPRRAGIRSPLRAPSAAMSASSPRVDAEAGRASVGQARNSTVRSGRTTSSWGCPVGVAGHQLVQHGAVRLRHDWRQQRGRGDHQHTGRLGVMVDRVQVQGEVAVRYPAGRRTSPWALAPSCAIGPAPPAQSTGLAVG
jgi:hypothetical protein